MPATPAPLPLRVLIADDYPDALESLRLLLQVMGHEVRAARDGQEALDLAADFRPHVVLLDMQMPRLCGGEVARRLREIPGCGGALVVATTATEPGDDRFAHFDGDFDARLTKPYSMQGLEALLAEAAARAKG